MEKIGIYIHIPFCAKKCPYCDFYSVGYHKGLAEEYVRALTADMERYRGKGIAADTLYFGGGTPSLIPPEMIARLTETAEECFGLENAEITLEANPNTISSQRISAFRRAGINRISLGMQSSEQRELEALGRSHTASRAAQAVETAYEGGISNISLDVMLGTPGQTRESILHTLEFAVSLPVSHLSAYLLKVEPETAYWNSPILKECADEQEQADIYLETVSFLEQHGFGQYEISNFAKPGKESRHNLKYWRCEEYLGFGPAAHSYFGGKRYGNPRDIAGYIAAPGRNARVTDEAPGDPEEKVMLGLRLTEGVPLEWFGELPEGEYGKLIRECGLLENAGYLSLAQGKITLTPKGFLLSNTIIAELLRYLPEQ